MVSSTASASRGQKRARTAKSDDSDDSAKRRGRPRVEKQDESAADVRRLHDQVFPQDLC